MIDTSDLLALKDFSADYQRARHWFLENDCSDRSLNYTMSRVSQLAASVDFYVTSTITMARRFLFNVDLTDLNIEVLEVLEESSVNALSAAVEQGTMPHFNLFLSIALSRYFRFGDSIAKSISNLPMPDFVKAAEKLKPKDFVDMSVAENVGSMALLALTSGQTEHARTLLGLQKRFKFFPKAEKLLRNLIDATEAQVNLKQDQPLTLDQETRALFFWKFDNYRVLDRKPELMFESDALQLCNSTAGCIVLADFYLRRLSSKPSLVPSFGDVRKLITWKGI
jgi:hypothetical protein